MKFKVAKERLFWWPVKVAVPDPDPARAGKMIQQQFNMQFLSMPQDDAKKEQIKLAGMDLQERIDREHDLLKSVCRDWDDQVVDEDGQAIPFSKEMLSSLIADNFFRIGLYSAYQEAMSGDGARLKN